MNISKIRSLEKLIKKDYKIPNRKHKNFNKRAKTQKEDKEKEMEEKRKNYFTEKDEDMTKEEKEYIQFLKDMGEKPEDYYDEMLKTRELKKDVPKEVRNFRPKRDEKGKKFAPDGYFTCIYCSQHHNGWHRHRFSCPERLFKKCEFCNLYISTTQKKHDRICRGERNCELCKGKYIGPEKRHQKKCQKEKKEREEKEKKEKEERDWKEFEEDFEMEIEKMKLEFSFE